GHHLPQVRIVLDDEDGAVGGRAAAARLVGGSVRVVRSRAAAGGGLGDRGGYAQHQRALAGGSAAPPSRPRSCGEWRLWTGIIRLLAPYSSKHSTGRSGFPDRKSTRLNSSHVKSSYAVFCCKKKKFI